MKDRLLVLYPGVEANQRPEHTTGATESASRQPASPMAARLQTLAGARIALLDNTKVKARELLLAVAEQLQAKYQVAEVKYWRKATSSAGAGNLQEIRDWCPDLVLTGSGD